MLAPREHHTLHLGNRCAVCEYDVPPPLPHISSNLSKEKKRYVESLIVVIGQFKMRNKQKDPNAISHFPIHIQTLILRVFFCAGANRTNEWNEYGQTGGRTDRGTKNTSISIAQRK